MEHKDFVECLKKYRELIWPVIDNNLKTIVDFEKSCRPKKKYQFLVDLHQEIFEVYPKRMGKYFRPSMVMLTGEAMGVSRDKLLNTAAAQQLSEEWILIHDDVEDDSAQRRGKEALHHIYSKELAINAGDALHVLMWRMLQNNRKIIGEDKTFEIMAEFSRMLNRTVLGQTIEIKWTQENKKNLEDEDILLILESKTGYYTVAGPMREGAIIAGASPNQMEKIYEFGKLTGYCFQIKDDLLDLTSDFAGLKKQTGNDIYEGKRTIMLAHLMRVIEGEDKRKLSNVLEKDRYHKSPDEVEWVIEKMKEYGSLDYADRLMKKFGQEAQEYFLKNLGFLKKSPARDFLEYLPEFLINRDH
ncbi:polyprenyl synthetase family protein [Patescibacteria group bacterium]|nr:polyprenyl synthetase family protein [Patescibacteria group bacterium]